MSHTFTKHPDDVRPYHVVWCSPNNTNDGSASDTGELQGETISTSDWTVPTGITEDSEGQAGVTIKGITYAVNTVATIWLSSGTDDTDYTLTNTIVTSAARTLNKEIVIRVRSS